MKKHRRLCRVLGLVTIILFAIALIMNFFLNSSFLSSCPREGASRSSSALPQWMPDGAAVVDSLAVAAKGHQDVAELQSQLLSSQEEVARLRRQILRNAAQDDCDSAVVRPRDPYKPTSRHSVIEWDSFDEKHTFSSFMNGQSQPGEKAQGISRQDVLDVKEAALQLINNYEHKEYTLVQLVHGFRRTDRLHGTEYVLDLFLKSSDGPASKRVHLLRPFAEPTLEKLSTFEDLHVHVNLVLPLAKRIEVFEQFMYRFRKYCIGQKFLDIFLIIVYFGEENRQDVVDLLAKYRDVFSWNNYKVITVSGPFSRGVGLLKGAEYVRDSDSDHRLMFFCDVDIRFTPAFLQRCYRNPILGKRIYYPVVFSLYNPALSPTKHDSHSSIFIKRETGFWRDFGFGMVCLYVEDFFNVGGFDLSIEGWGGEDVDLYTKFVQSGFDSMRSVDEGIYHIWHEKQCRPELTSEQYQSCMNSKISTSGSQKQLGNIIIEQQERISQLEKEMDAEKKLLSDKGILNGTFTGDRSPLASYLAAAGKKEAQNRRLKVYVYELPADFNAKQIDINDKDPPAIWDYDCTTNAFSAEYAIHQQLLDSEFRTRNAEEADFYYIPVYLSCYCINLNRDPEVSQRKAAQFGRRALDYVRNHYPYFNHSLGRDHVWTFTTSAGAGIFFGSNDEGTSTWEMIKNGIFFIQSGLLFDSAFSPHKDIVIPSFLDPNEVIALYSVPFTDRPTRAMLAHYSGLRFKSERAQKSSSMIVNYLVKKYSRVPRFRISATRTKTYYLDMMSALFCLCPQGQDEVGSRRVYESIILGCIPVLLGEDVELAFEDRIDYSKFVLRIHTEQLDHLHTILLNVKPEEVSNMQREMERSWTAISYNKKTGHVLDNIIYSLLRHKRETSMKLVYRNH
eukprot:m.310278 g.310278  ORF g.310278 m.310278 type:complete len:899 (+) comp50624_c0_seq1:79-2775(+)